MQQPTVGLTLASAYPLAIRGVVNLGFESDTFAIDPALVFSTGSRSVTFQIPAGETEAIFSNGTRQIRFQTGTIAGTILLTPQFVAAEFDITPPGASTLRLTLPASLPRLTNLQIGSLSAGSVTFLVTGAATTRSVSTVEFVFNKIASSTAVFSETKVVVGLQNLSETYFRSPESSAFGGQFRAIVPFNFSATSGTAPDLLTVIESATVTLTNREGVSNTMTVPLR